MTPDSDLVARAPELEAQVMKTAEAGDRAGLFAHALALYRLADVRIRLGDPSAAVSLAQRAAAIWGGDRVADTEAVAAARALAAAALASIGRLDEAVAEFEGLVLQHAGFPKTTLPGLTTGALSLWLSLLQQSTDWEKLYEVAGLVRAHLDPESGRKDWEVWMEASVLRATAAGELGHAVESIELLEDAVSRLDVEGGRDHGFLPSSDHRNSPPRLGVS